MINGELLYLSVKNHGVPTNNIGWVSRFTQVSVLGVISFYVVVEAF